MTPAVSRDEFLAQLDSMPSETAGETQYYFLIDYAGRRGPRGYSRRLTDQQGRRGDGGWQSGRDVHRGLREAMAAGGVGGREVVLEHARAS